jgi:membrane protein DedA with SNARE-associated domain
MTISAIVTQLGPLGVFLLMVPESACIPVPSEVTLLAAGFAVHQGWMSFWVAVGAATAGNLVGSLLGYQLGRMAAGRLSAGWAARGLRRCDAVFARHGDRAVFLARLMPLARTFVSLPAGHARVGLARFTVMTSLGCGLWAAGFVLLGALLGSGWNALAGRLDGPLLAIGIVGVVVALMRTGSADRGPAGDT